MAREIGQIIPPQSHNIADLHLRRGEPETWERRYIGKEIRGVCPMRKCDKVRDIPLRPMALPLIGAYLEMVKYGRAWIG